MDERKRQVLQAIIDDYISTAEPIGSRTIARKAGLGVSPATIRNEMSDLEALGFLEQPHASAGRIPSAKGYRFYVDCLMGHQQVSDQDTVLINQWFEQKVRRLDEAFQETVRVLSRMTKNVSLLVAPQATLCKFKYLQFLPFDETRVVVVVVTDTGVIENRIMEIPPGTSTEELQRISGALNHWLGGLAIPDIQSSLLEKIKADVLPRPELLNNALALLREAAGGPSGGEKNVSGRRIAVIGSAGIPRYGQSAQSAVHAGRGTPALRYSAYAGWQRCDCDHRTGEQIFGDTGLQRDSGIFPH